MGGRHPRRQRVSRWALDVGEKILLLRGQEREGNPPARLSGQSLEDLQLSIPAIYEREQREGTLSTKPPETRETLTQRAEHARQLAKLLPSDEAAGRLTDYAKELEAQAVALGDGHKEG